LFGKITQSLLDTADEENYHFFREGGDIHEMEISSRNPLLDLWVVATVLSTTRNCSSAIQDFEFGV
jgi:hypothetical protein